MRLSARNVLKGRVVKVIRGQTTAHVKLDVGGGSVITASVTVEAVDELGLREGDAAYAVIKASDVIVAKDSQRHRDVRRLLASCAGADPRDTWSTTRPARPDGCSKIST
jgi:molybdopterin-binding protein